MRDFLTKEKYNFCHLLLAIALTVIACLIVRLPINILALWVITVCASVGLTIYGLLHMP